MEIGGTWMCLGLSGFTVPAVWSRNTSMSQPWNQRIVRTWDILDIKIPKPPSIRFPKIIGFVHFLICLVPSEKYYNWQSRLNTLYWFRLYHYVFFSKDFTAREKEKGKGGSSGQQFLLTSPLQVKYQTNYLAEARKYLGIQKCEKSPSRKIGLAVFRGGCNWALLIGPISGWRVAERGDIYSNILNWLPNPAMVRVLSI